jgi:hypothetical protein
MQGTGVFPEGANSVLGERETATGSLSLFSLDCQELSDPRPLVLEAALPCDVYVEALELDVTSAPTDCSVRVHPSLPLECDFDYLERTPAVTPHFMP